MAKEKGIFDHPLVRFLEGSLATTEQMISLAMNYDNQENRKWLKAKVPLPYGSESERCDIWILEGSPVRGFIISHRDFVLRLDGGGKLLKTYDMESAVNELDYYYTKKGASHG